MIFLGSGRFIVTHLRVALAKLRTDISGNLLDMVCCGKESKDLCEGHLKYFTQHGFIVDLTFLALTQRGRIDQGWQR